MESDAVLFQAKLREESGSMLWVPQAGMKRLSSSAGGFATVTESVSLRVSPKESTKTNTTSWTPSSRMVFRKLNSFANGFPSSSQKCRLCPMDLDG